MSLLSVLISGSRWAHVMLRWISKPFQCINMFWLCILIRHRSQIKHYWQYFALSYPSWACWSHSTQLRGHWLQNHIVGESCPDDAPCCSVLACLPPQISFVARLGKHRPLQKTGLSVKSHEIWSMLSMQPVVSTICLWIFNLRDVPLLLCQQGL